MIGTLIILGSIWLFGFLLGELFGAWRAEAAAKRVHKEHIAYMRESQDQFNRLANLLEDKLIAAGASERGGEV